MSSLNVNSKIAWKNSPFSNSYGIYSNGQVIGKLKEMIFSQTSHGEINGRKYTFKTHGFFNQKTHIIDQSEQKVIGIISYNNWKAIAKISIHHQENFLKIDNIFHTKWSISDASGLRMQFKGSFTEGEINPITDDELLLLSGLFVKNYFTSSSIAMLVAILVPVFLTLMK